MSTARRLSTVSLRRIVAIMLVAMMIGSLLPAPASAAVLHSTDQTVRAVGNQALTLLTSALGALGIGAAEQGRRERRGVRPSPPLSKAEREAQVASIDSNVTGDITLRSREPLQLTAIPLDQQGRTIQGLRVKWESSDKRVIFVRKNGNALAGLPGEATLTARVGGAQKTIRVTVVEGTNEPYGGKKRVDSTRKSQQVLRQRMKTAGELAWSGRKSRRQQRSHAVSKLAGLSPVVPFIRPPNEDPLPDNETTSLYSPNNLIGTPPGKKKPGAMTAASSLALTESGNRNFSFDLPIVGLRGRGVDVALSLVYNSLLWHKSVDPSDSSTWMTYDVDSGYPAQGFRLGFGQIEDQGSAGFTLTEADGTRRALVYSSAYNYDTTDGSFIHFTGGSGWGTLFYPDGTQVTYGAAGGGYRSYPSIITDRNGNYISISYVNNVGPRISTILDTVGRYVRFYYDSNNDLVTITMPGLTGQSDLQVMRFYYDNLTLPSGLFQSGINVDNPSTARVIKYIYMPTTGEGSSSTSGDVGYRFDYSAYGMIYRILRIQGMTVSTTSTSSIGSITSSETSSNTAATTTYSYDTTAAALSDVPTFAHRTDEWAGRTGGGSAPEYDFAVSEGSTETTSTVTAPDDSVMVTTSIKNTGNWDDGLVKEIRVQNSTPVVFSKTQFTWEQNSSNGTPRVANIKFTNEANKTTATVFTYDSNTPYNNVSVVSERDFTTDGSLGSEVRRTETTYVTSSSYLNRRLLHLPSMVKVFPGGSSTAASRIDYGYDNYGTSHADMTSRNDIIMHDVAFDPFQEPQEIWDWVCTEWGYNESGFYGCFNWEWQLVSYYYPYDSNTDYRGNVTSVTTYPDATSTSNAITHTTKYDIAGNVMSAQVDCCQSESFTYSTANDDYAYPITITKGDPGGLHLTVSTSYDMNTGLMATSTDANTRTTSFTYNPDTLRTDVIDFPDGGQTSYDYVNELVADSASRYHSKLVITTKLDSSRYVDSKSYLDGRGAVTQTFNRYTSGDGWSIVDTEYDSMGRAYRFSNPYYCTTNYGSCSINPSGVWITRTFDTLGRTTQVTSPRGDDANPSYITTVSTTYAGDVTTITDQAGKQRRQLRDALGRVIRLDEPTSSGLGAVGSANQSTSYMYDALNNLVKITQDAQTRYFKYDSLSRLIREKVAEQTANSSYDLSDSLTGNSSWSKKLEYNSHGLVTNAYDARGISATYAYDGLNRLTGIDYSDSTPDRHYYYDSQTLPSGAPTYDHGYANGRLIGMTYGSGASGTYFGYDNMGRVKEQRQVTGGNTYSLSYTYNLAGLLATETYPTSRVLTYSYDNAGRLSQISDGTTTFASGMTYAPTGGLLSETWGNGAVRSIGYNNASQVSQIKLKQSSSGSELQRYDYLYGEVTQSTGSVDKSKNNGQIGRVDGVINGSSTKEWDQRFSYDELGRLSIAAEYQQGTGSSPTWKQEFTYDRYGNRFQSGSGNTPLNYTPVVSSDITASTNRFITSGSTPVTYDAAGNITQDAKFRFLNYTYDAEGRQVSVAAIDSDLSQTSVYDCVGQRVQTTSFNTTRTMVYDIFGQLVADYNGTSMEKENIYRGGHILAVYEAASTCYMTISAFVTAFFQGALDRPPTSTELSTWTSDLSKAQAQGNASLIKKAQALGTAVFTSSEYTNTNHNAYVTDLYAAFLQRSPDSGGEQNWLNALAGGATFAQVRNGFAYSLEFQGNVVRLCPGTSTSTSTGANLKYVLTDLQGSARALMDNSGSGSSTIVGRHDYLPFGEEIWAGVGLRTSSQKYSVTDKARQRFALTERDEATGLDHTAFRKYDSFAGRWTTPDPLPGGVIDPQSFNRYSYTKNDPINSVDPKGLCTFNIQLSGVPDFARTDLENEITRIFETGGHKVVFGKPGEADGGSFNLNVTAQFPDNVVAEWQTLAKMPLPADTLGLTIPSQNAGYLSTDRFNAQARPGGYAGQASYGAVLGRIGAHEAITHGFLQKFFDTDRGDVTTPSGARALVAKNTSRWDIDDKTKAELAKLCDKSKNPTPPPPRPGPIVGGLPDPPGSHGPGVDFPRLYNPGGPSELDWLIWLTDRMRPPPEEEEEPEIG